MSDTAIEILERWERCGGTWKVRSLSPDAVEIELCTCYGEPVDALRSTEPGFVAQIRGSVGTLDGSHGETSVS